MESTGKPSDLQFVTDMKQTRGNHFISSRLFQKATLGSTVYVKRGKSLAVVKLVHPIEEDLLAGCISIFSSLGQAIIGKRINQSVKLVTPNGHITFKVVKVD